MKQIKLIYLNTVLLYLSILKYADKKLFIQYEFIVNHVKNVFNSIKK